MVSLDCHDNNSVYRINCAICCSCSPTSGFDWQFSTPSIIEPGDILFGRGRKNSTHPGNKIFKRIIKLHEDRYSTLATRDEKTQISHEVVEQLRLSGRFLKECDKHPGCWVEVDNETARVKVAQALQYRRRSGSKSIHELALNKTGRKGPIATSEPLRTISLPVPSTNFAALLKKCNLNSSKSMTFISHSKAECEHDDSTVSLFDVPSDSEDDFLSEFSKACPPPPPLRLVDSLTILEPYLLEPLPFSDDDPLERVPRADLLSMLSPLLQDPLELGLNTSKTIESMMSLSIPSNSFNSYPLKEPSRERGGIPTVSMIS